MSMPRMIILFVAFLFCGLLADNSARELYDIGLPNFAVVNVSTLHHGLINPMGVAVGVYNSKPGVFVSSFKTTEIYFIDTSNRCGDSSSCVLTKVAGTGVSGISDGALSSASFTDPSRMVYVSELNVLFVTDRANGIIRFINFNSDEVGTLKTATGTRLAVVGSAIADNNPEIDIKYSGEYLYISDSQNVYNVTGADGTLATALTAAVMRRYTALKAWQLANDYDITTRKVYLTSIAINAEAGVMYVSYSYQRNAIVVCPLAAKSMNEISVLTSDGKVYNIPASYPRPRNGVIGSAAVNGFDLVTFPMHMQYDATDQTLYWIEAFAHLSSGTAAGALGAIAVRRLRFSTMEVDYYAGNTGTFRNILGKVTGYKDGGATYSEFSYPVSLSFAGSTASIGGGPLLYIIDYTNTAVRRVHTTINTPSPTLQPTISHRPTHAPTYSHAPTPAPSRSPTLAPSPYPTMYPTLKPTTAAPSSSAPSYTPTPQPTASPTLAPTISHAPTINHAPTSMPTALNGSCLSVYLLDHFGDGWGDTVMYLSHPDPSSNGTLFYELAPSFQENPLVRQICASMDIDRIHMRGEYIFYVQSPTKDVRNNWEIFVRITEEVTGEFYTGSLNTIMAFNFADGVFTLEMSDNLIDNTFSCNRCTHPPPKPKPISPPPPKAGGSQEFSSLEPVLLERNLLLKAPPPPPKKYPIPFVLHDDGGDGWFYSSGVGTSYYITDRKKTRLVASGTLCGDYLKDDCQESLPNGDYYFRVGGAGDENRDQIAWTFCKRHSFAQYELSFSIVDGECIPGYLASAETLATAVETTVIHMQGHVLLANVIDTKLSLRELELIETSLAEVMHLCVSDVVVVSYCVAVDEYTYCNNDDDDDDSPNANTVARKLSTTFVLSLTVSIDIVAENYGVTGSHYSDMVLLANETSQNFTDSIHSGAFQSILRRYATDNLPNSVLHFVRTTKPSELMVTDIDYRFVATLSPDSIDHETPLSEIGGLIRVVNDESSMQVILLVVPCAFVLVAAGIVVVVHLLNKKRKACHAVSVSRGRWRSVLLDDAGLPSQPPEYNNSSTETCHPTIDDVNIFEPRRHSYAAHAFRDVEFERGPHISVETSKSALPSYQPCDAVQSAIQMVNIRSPTDVFEVVTIHLCTSVLMYTAGSGL